MSHRSSNKTRCPIIEHVEEQNLMMILVSTFLILKVLTEMLTFLLRNIEQFG